MKCQLVNRVGKLEVRTGASLANLRGRKILSLTDEELCSIIEAGTELKTGEAKLLSDDDLKRLAGKGAP